MRCRSAEKDFSAERLLLYADENLRKGKKMKERTKEIVNTADVEFTCQIGNAEFFEFYVSYPLPEKRIDEESKPRHRHNYYEVVYIEDGEAIFETEGFERAIKSGGFIIETPACEHKVRGIENCRAFKFGFTFIKKRGESDNVYDTFFQALGKLDYEIREGASPLGTYCRQFASSIGRFGSVYRQRAAFTNIVFYLFERLADRLSLSLAKEQGSVENKNVKDVIGNALLYHYTTDISAKELSEKVFLCPRQINRICQKLYGRTFNGQKLLFRVENAKELLEKTDKSILDICLESGFNSTGSFYAAFSHEVGMSPKNYRKASRERGK